jgi:hypothetical protein
VAAIVDGKDGHELQSFTGHTGGIWRLAWSPDGQRLATGGQDGSVRIYNTVSGDQVLILQPGAGDTEIRALDWSHDGRRLMTGGFDQRVRLWDGARGYDLERADELKAKTAQHPDDAAAWLEFADLCSRIGWVDQARRAYASAAKARPDDTASAEAARRAEEQFQRLFAPDANPYPVPSN